MKSSAIRCLAVFGFSATLLCANDVSAQFIGNGQMPNNAQPLLPMMGNGMAQNTSNLTPQQLQSLMMMRAMSGRGRRGVQTGYPQNIPLGNPSFSAPQMFTPPPVQQTSKHKPAGANRADAKKVKANLKQAANKDAKAKKAKAAKKPAVDKDEQAAK